MDINALLETQRQAFWRDGTPDLATRLERLSLIKRLLLDHGEAFASAISADFGQRSVHETRLLEIGPLIASLRHTMRHLKGWMKPQKRGSSLEFALVRNKVVFQPLGVVGILVPWNYPLFLSIGPLIDVLAAGNRAIIKPSELLPSFSALFAEKVAEMFSADVVSVVTGGVEVADAFSRLPLDHLVFTGSTAVGKKVMAACAEHLTPHTLELGGKSPVFVGEDYPLERAAKDIMAGKLLNAGQTCIAPDYVLVQRGRMEALSSELIKEIARLYPSLATNPDYSSLVSDRHHVRLTKAVDEARQHGLTVLQGEAPVWQDRRLPPTLVLDPPDDILLMREEIFGPVLPIKPYDTLQDAIGYVRSHDHPLALYILSHDKAAQDQILGGTLSGNVTINATVLHVAQNDLPFGGIGPSGHGAYHGFDGFKRFSHARGIAQSRLFNPMDLLAPPFGRLTQFIERFTLR